MKGLLVGFKFNQHKTYNVFRFFFANLKIINQCCWTNDKFTNVQNILGSDEFKMNDITMQYEVVPVLC